MAKQITTYSLQGGVIAQSIKKRNKKTYPTLWIIINNITGDQVKVEGSIHFVRDLRITNLPITLVKG